MKKVIFFLLLVGTVLVLLGGCAASKKETKPAEPADKAAEMDESFDPVALDDKDISFKEDKPQPIPTETNFVPDQDKPEEAVNKKVDGFRVQLFSSKEIENANKAKFIASEQFDDLDSKIYLEFDSPLYKVRLGDFQSRDEAERVREVVQSRGYPKAWIVKTRVWSNPELFAPSDTTEADLPDILN